MKSRLIASCAAAALAVGMSDMAQAQSAPAATPAPMPADADPENGDAGGNIVVTAQRRSESLRDVPLTVQAFTGETLSRMNVKSLDDLVKYTPNVTFGRNGPGQGTIFMRGLSAGLAGTQSSATIANFPNVALYLDDQSMQFPGRNADVYAVDLDRIEVLEGPQGTLFGGGAQAGAIRYITNKPKLDRFEGHAEAGYGFTSGGSANAHGTLTLNVPILADRLAVRATLYNDRRGGYIDNVPSRFTRSNEDLGNFYFNLKPTGGLCPNGQPAGAAGLCALPGAPVADNAALARKDFNPVTYTGARVAAALRVNDDWDALISESLQNLDTDGMFVQYPTGSQFQTLKPLEVTAFSPSYSRDRFSNTAWTVNGKVGPLHLIYIGGFMDRHITQQLDYTNYSRSAGGMYYQCTGGSTGWGSGTPRCYSPAVYWRDRVRNTHLSNEVRLSTPAGWRLRGVVGVFHERFRIEDVMNFHYKTIPSCSTQNLTIALSGGPVCVANVRTAPNATANDPGVRDDATAFGADVRRGYDQLALFASADFDIVPDVLTLTGGTRYFRYRQFLVGSQYGTTTGCLNVPNGQCSSGMVNIDAANDHVTEAGFRSRASLTWHVDHETTAYFTFSQGFRPGGFNRSVSNVAPGPDRQNQFRRPNGYSPDSLDNFELGLKTGLLDDRLQLNLSAYSMTWRNVQFLFFNPPYLGNTTFGVNGPDFNIKGAEVQLFARPLDGLTVMGSASYNRNRQTSSPCLIGNIPGTGAYGKCIEQIIPRGGTTAVPFQNPFGAPGATAPFSPAFQGSLRGRYERTTGAYRPYVSAGVTYTDAMYNQPATYTSGEGVLIPSTTFLRFRQPGYATVDASIGVRMDRWTVELFGTNLTNSHASAFTSTAQFIRAEVPIRPRIVELKVGMDF